MLKLSMDGITSFSYKPLKLASIAGIALSAIGFISMFLVLYLKLFTNSTITGWSSLIVIQLFFSGIILFMLGMIGEYIGRIYDEAKDRPLYIVRESYGLQSKPHPVQPLFISSNTNSIKKACETSLKVPHAFCIKRLFQTAFC